MSFFAVKKSAAKTVFSLLQHSLLHLYRLFGFYKNLSVGCRCVSLTNKQYQCNDRYHIWNHGNQVRGYHIALCCQRFDTTAETKQKACLCCALR